jgi:tRNA(Ile)-lysidine synthase TilS/MesJ
MDVANSELVTIIKSCVAKYDLIHSNDGVIVALSGGKDSLVLCIILRELEIPYSPVVIDMGYSPGWGARILSNAQACGIFPSVVEVRQFSEIDDNASVRERLKILDEGFAGREHFFTPCTYCHGVKISVLRETALRLGAPSIALGQHRTDAAVSLIKEALMHIDHGRSLRGNFSRARYQELVDEFATEARSFVDGDTPLMREIAGLVRSGKIDTDEPPRETLPDSGNIDIIRPMFDATERDIIALQRSLALAVEDSGCFHGLHPSTYTPREMIHYGVLQSLDNPAFDEWVNRMVMLGIDAQGKQIVRSRSRRSEFLGIGYKPVERGLDKFS